LALFALGILLLSFSLFDQSYSHLGVGGCVLMGSAVIAGAIVGPKVPGL
jgi:hypothetical protein